MTTRVPFPWLLRAAGIAFSLVACSCASAAAVGDALDRPAVAAAQPARSVLLDASLAGTRIVAVGERGIVALSDDGARTWRQASVPTSVTLTVVRFADARHGWAAGHGGALLATDDGGEHWTRLLDGRRAAQIVLDSARASGDARAVRDAERLVTDGPDKPWLDLLVRDAQRLLVVGAYGLALHSDDGGRTWSAWTPRLPNPKGLHLYAARQHGAAVLLAGEQGLAMLSHDEGRTFRRLETPYKGSWFAADLASAQEIVLAGLRGTVLRSPDGGDSWTPLATPMRANITALARDERGRLLAVSQAGFVLGRDGERLVPLHAQPLPPPNGLLATPGGLLALTIQGALPVPAAP